MKNATSKARTGTSSRSAAAPSRRPSSAPLVGAALRCATPKKVKVKNADRTTRKPAPSEQESQRRCLASGETLPKEQMIRFVLDDVDCVRPDLAGNLPGRGLWVRATRADLELAIKKNLFSRAAKTKAVVPSDLFDQVLSLLAGRCLNFLGLAKGAGLVVPGMGQVEERRSDLAVVILASDAGGDALKKMNRLPKLPALFSRVALGGALGRDVVAVLGLQAHPLTEKLKRDWARYEGILGLPAVTETNEETSNCGS